MERHFKNLEKLHQQFIDIFFIQQKNTQETAALLNVNPKIIQQLKKELDTVWRPITEVRDKWKSKEIGGSFWDFYHWVKTTEKCCHYCKITQEELNQLHKIGINNKRTTRGRTLEIDRKISEEKYDNFSNLTYACYWCNNAKTDTFTEEEFLIIGKSISYVWKQRLANREVNLPQNTTMKTIIDKPSNIPADLFDQLLKLVEEGAQVDPDGLEERIINADLIAISVNGNAIVSMATLKNPAISYRDKVFKSANVGENKGLYEKELGYIVTNPDYEGQGHCQRLLNEFMPYIAAYKIFATTRKDAMAHILTKLGFQKFGDIFKNDLQLLIYSGKK